MLNQKLTKGVQNKGDGGTRQFLKNVQKEAAFFRKTFPSSCAFLRDTNTLTNRHTGTLIYRHRKTDTHTQRHTDAQTHKQTDIQTYIPVNMQ